VATHLPDLYLREGEARARVRPIEVDLERRPPHRMGPPEDRSLDSFDLVLMRKDPPVDTDYAHGATILAAAAAGVPVVNDPLGILLSNEKLLPLQIPGAAPPTLLTADPEVAAEFARAHEEVVVKPLNEFSGRGIIRLSTRGSALDADAVGALAAHRGRHVLVQRFLPEVERGDKRVFVLDGEPIGWVNRVPPAGSFLANIHQGASVEPTELTDRERSVIEAARPILRERGLEMAGFDFIGEWLTEINVTSPSAMRQIDRVMGTRLETVVVDRLEVRAAEGPRPVRCVRS
jgi:glutathione synthase